MHVGDAYIVNSDIWLVDESGDRIWVSVKPDNIDFGYVVKDSILLFYNLSNDDDYNFMLITPNSCKINDTADFNINEINEFMTKIR